MKRHILFVIDSLAGGGAEKIMCNLVSGLDTGKFKASIYMSLDSKIEYDIPDTVKLYSSANQELMSTDNNDSRIELLIERIAKFYNFKYFTSKECYSKKREEMEKFLGDLYLSSKVLNGIIQKEKPDLIVSFLVNSNLIVLINKYLFKTDIPACCSDHTILSREIKSFPYLFCYRMLIKLLYKRSDYHIAVSEGSKDDLVKYCWLPKDKVIKIYNGIDIENVKKESEEKLNGETEEILQDKNTKKIITSGRLTNVKNHELLIRAYNKMQFRSNTKLLILGTGEKKEKLQNLANNLGIGDDVLFLGWRKNPFNIISRCDLFVLSSDWEGLPLVIIEAMSLGIPVISTDCPSGPGEILENGKCGVLVKPKDENKLADAITKLLSDRQLRYELSELAKRRANDFSLKTMIDNYEELFTNILQ
ncbi:MAG: glycosyltransferase [Thermodesulfobacteriota bacterium]